MKKFHVGVHTKIEKALGTLKLSSRYKMYIICFLLIYVAK